MEHVAVQLIRLIAGSVIVVVSFFYHFVFFVRVKRRTLRMAEPYADGYRSVRDASWVGLCLSGLGALLISFGGPIELPVPLPIIAVFGGMLLLHGLWLGRQRKFIVFGEIQLVAEELIGLRNEAKERSQKFVDKLNERQAQLGKAPLPFGKEKPYTRERHFRESRPMEIVIGLNIVALIGCFAWTFFAEGENQTFSKHMCVVLGLCLLVEVAFQVFWLSSAPKK